MQGTGRFLVKKPLLVRPMLHICALHTCPKQKPRPSALGRLLGLYRPIGPKFGIRPTDCRNLAEFCLS